MKNILVIPIDNRPITYSLTSDITKVHKSLNLSMPDRKLLGGLIEKANIDEILSWIKNQEENDLIIISLDTIAYGGLVSSRRGNESFDEIKDRAETLKNILKEKKSKNPNLKIYATSSIMRISNNNVNEEEKEYWNVWGTRIFSYSYHQHKSRRLKEYNCVNNIIPKEILDDYLDTRKRNFEINKLYLTWLEENILDYLIYSKDDTGEFGLNVEEAEILDNEIKKRNLKAIVKTGADEIPLALLTKGLTIDEKIKIKIEYKNPNSIDLISRYEDISVKQCVIDQIKIGIENVEIVDVNPDIILYVNNFDKKQGDLVFQDIINKTTTPMKNYSIPYMIADINNANGSDNNLIEEILDKKFNENLLSYSGYNTSANTIGSAICFGITTYLAKKTNNLNKENHKNLLAIRFLDDWGYQANIRKFVQESKDFNKALSDNLNNLKTFEDKVKKYLNHDFVTHYNLPWNRSFEIEINLSK